MRKHPKRYAAMALLSVLFFALPVRAATEQEKPGQPIYKYTGATQGLPWIPENYQIVDWKEVASNYLERIFENRGQYFYEAPGLYHTEKTRLGIISEVGEDPSVETVEAMTLITMLLSHTTLESEVMPKSDFLELAEKVEGYYSLDEGENVFLNYMDTKSRDLTFYEQIYPGLLYFMLMDKIEATENSEDILRQIADGWHEVIMKLGGNDRLVDFAYAGYDFTAKAPFHEDGHLEIDAAAGLALIQYYAFQKFQDRKYIRAAQYCMNYLDTYKGHYGHRLLYFYMPYLAARLNDQEGFKYDVARHMGLAFEPTSENWGWLGPDQFAHGLVGSRTDYGGTAYTFESIMALTALVPTLKYDSRYANEIGRQILYATHELGEQAKLRSRCRDVATRVESLKSQAAMGYLASMLELTDLPEIFRVDLNVGDFYQEYLEDPCFLLFNPYEEAATLTYKTASDDMVGLYDLVTREFLYLNVKGEVDLEIPATQSVIVLEIPMEEGDNQYQVGKKVEKQAPGGIDASIAFKHMKENEVLTQDTPIKLEMDFRETNLGDLEIYVDGKQVFKNMNYDQPFVLRMDEVTAGYHLIQAKMTTSSGTVDSAYIQVFVDNNDKGSHLFAEGEAIGEWGGESPVVEVDFSKGPILELKLSQYKAPWSMELIDVKSGLSYPIRVDSIEAGQLDIPLEDIVESGSIHLFGKHEIQLSFPSDLDLESLRIYDKGFSPLEKKEWTTAFTPQKMVQWPAGKKGQLNYRDGVAILNNGVSKTDWFEVRLDKNPRLKLEVTETSGVWSLLAYVDGADGPMYLQYPTSKVGTFTYDLAELDVDFHYELKNIQIWMTSDGEVDAHTYLDYLSLAYKPSTLRLASASLIGVLSLIMVFVEIRRES